MTHCNTATQFIHINLMFLNFGNETSLAKVLKVSKIKYICVYIYMYVCVCLIKTILIKNGFT